MHITDRIRELTAFGELYYASSLDWITDYLSNSEELHKLIQSLAEKEVSQLVTESIRWIANDNPPAYRHPHEMTLVIALEVLHRLQPSSCYKVIEKVLAASPERLGWAYQLAELISSRSAYKG